MERRRGHKSSIKSDDERVKCDMFIATNVLERLNWLQTPTQWVQDKVTRKGNELKCLIAHVKHMIIRSVLYHCICSTKLSQS